MVARFAKKTQARVYWIVVILVASQGSSTSAQAGFGSFCGKVIQSLQDAFRTSTIDDFQFPLGKPSEVFVRSLRDVFFSKAPRGSTIIPLNLETRLKIGSQIPIQADVAWFDLGTNSIIARNGEHENRLLKTSYLFNPPREVSSVRVFDRDGKLIASNPNLVIGGNSSISGDATFAQLGNLAYTPGAYLVELTHTHPSFELVGTTPKGAPIQSLHPLSGPDDHITAYISTFHSIAIREKAVLPSGYSYQKTFRSGRVVEDPMPLVGLTNPRPAIFSPVVSAAVASVPAPPAIPSFVDSFVSVARQGGLNEPESMRVAISKLPDVLTVEQRAQIEKVLIEVSTYENKDGWMFFEASFSRTGKRWTSVRAELKETFLNGILSIENANRKFDRLSVEEFEFCMEKIPFRETGELAGLVNKLPKTLSDAEYSSLEDFVLFYLTYEDKTVAHLLRTRFRN